MQNIKINQPTTYITTAILVMSLGFNVYFFTKTSDNSTKSENTEKKIISKDQSSINLELDKLKEQLNAANKGNTELETKFKQKDRELLKKAEDLKKILAGSNITKQELIKVKKEASLLKENISHRIKQIDSLRVQNSFLKNNNKQLKDSVKTAAMLNIKLQEKNKTLMKNAGLAYSLKIAELDIYTDRKKSNGKYTETIKAKKVNRVAAEFKLVDNDFAKEGPYDIYIEILDNAKNLIYDPKIGVGEITINAKPLQYTATATIEYKKSTENYAVAVVMDGWLPGDYKLNIYSSKSLMGSSTFYLR